MNIYFEGVLASMGINILLALSAYAILATDRLSLGNAGFMAIGAYLSSYLTVNLGWRCFPPWLPAPWLPRRSGCWSACRCCACRASTS